MQHVWVLSRMSTLISISFSSMFNRSLDIIKTSPIIDFGSRYPNKEWTSKRMDLVILNRPWIIWEMGWRKFLWIQSCCSIMLTPTRDLASIILQSSFSGLHNRYEKIGAMHIMEKLCLILNNKNSNWLQNVPKKLSKHTVTILFISESAHRLRTKKKPRNYKHNIKP